MHAQEKSYLGDGEDDSIKEMICGWPTALFLERSLDRPMNGVA